MGRPELGHHVHTARDDTGGTVDIPIHVDAASGGFVAPFLHPNLRWDFRLARVVSINVSGHKYGQVLPGVGWVVFRAREFLPRSMVHHVTYLGGSHPTVGLTYSRAAAPILTQYLQVRHT